MKRLLFIVFTLLFTVTLVQGRSSGIKKTTTVYEGSRGVVKLSGVRVGPEIAFTQHTLYKKAKQWADSTYKPGTPMLVDKNGFTVIADKYKLRLDFKDNVFFFTFFSDTKMTEKDEQLIINKLTEHIKTSKLSNPSW